MLANWLVCVVINAEDGIELTFCSDPVGGDGIIRNVATGEAWRTDTCMVPRLREGQTGEAEALILKAVQKKHCKGREAYARGKTLIVFLEAGTGAGKWSPNRVAQQLPRPLNFAAAWVVALKGVEKGEYIYRRDAPRCQQGRCPDTSRAHQQRIQCVARDANSMIVQQVIRS